MKKLLIMFLAFMLILCAGPAFAAGSCTQKIESMGSLKCLSLSWTSSSVGAFTDYTTKKIDGLVIMVLTDPDGTAKPTDNYDITLKNANGYDIMGGVLGNRNQTSTEVRRPYNTEEAAYMSVPVDGSLALAISNMGNSKQGVVKIYFYDRRIVDIP